MWRVKIEVALADGDADTPEGRRSFYMAVIDELERIGASDPDLEGDLSGSVALSVAVPASEDLALVVCDGLTTIRTAIHAAGGATPDWPPCTQIQVDDDGSRWIVAFQRSSQERVLSPA